MSLEKPDIKRQRGGLREPKGGRPYLSENEKRVRCGWMTLPLWLKDWLLGQSKPAGRIVEEALVKQYGLNDERNK